jgi:peptidoglycan/xylan/chitin deacetylase (PgdA/CDA1 family)
MTWAGPALAAHVDAVARHYGLERRVGRDDAVVLTFDDGPHPQGTPAVLETLAAHGARATFFLVGEQVERDRGLARAIVDAGHEVALHGYRHTLLLRRRVESVAGDYDRALAAVEDATGRSPALYRPPYGVLSTGALREVRRRGWRPLLWSAWGRDWAAGATPHSIATRSTADLRGGDVLLLHDADYYSAPGSWQRTAAALPEILRAVADRGLRPVAIEDSEQTVPPPARC